MINIRDEANMTAIALVADAVTYSDAPSPAGSVMATVQPYLTRYWEAQGSPEGGTDIAAALSVLFASLAQVAGVAFWKYLDAQRGGPQAKETVLASLADFQLQFLLSPGETEEDDTDTNGGTPA